MRGEGNSLGAALRREVKLAICQREERRVNDLVKPGKEQTETDGYKLNY